MTLVRSWENLGIFCPEIFSAYVITYLHDTVVIFVCLSGGKYQFVLCYEYSCWRNDRINHTFHGQVTALIIIMLITNYLSGSGHTQKEMLLAFIGPVPWPSFHFVAHTNNSSPLFALPGPPKVISNS